MKKAKFVPIILASALLASCGTTTPDISSTTPSSETPTSSIPTGESTSSDVITPASSEEIPVSSETPVSSEVTAPSSSEEPVTPPASSEEPEPSTITSWNQITEGAKTQINEFFQYFDPESEEHKPDDYLPVLPVAPSIAWTYDTSYNPGRGVSVGLIALTGDDANENKALIAQYNQSIVAKGWAKATDDDLTDYSDAWCPIYGKNVYKFDDSASGALLIAEIIPCADAEGDDMVTYSPTDADGNEVTSGILFTVQVYETL